MASAVVVQNYAIATAAAVDRALGHDCAITPDAAAAVRTVDEFVGKMRDQLDIGAPFPGAQFTELPWRNGLLGKRLVGASELQLRHDNLTVRVSDNGERTTLFFNSGVFGNPPIASLLVHASGDVAFDFIDPALLRFNIEALDLLWKINEELGYHIVHKLVTAWPAAIPATWA